MGSLQTHIADRPQPVLREPGWPRKQLERRDGVGALPVGVRGCWTLTGANRMVGRNLPGRVGPRPTIYRSTVGLDRTQVADRFGHVGPVRGNRGDCSLECLLGLC